MSGKPPSGGEARGDASRGQGFSGYSAAEIQAYLPSGWRPADRRAGLLDAPAAVWELEVLDGADMPWRLAVSAAEAARHGRLEALRRAVDRLCRAALA